MIFITVFLLVHCSFSFKIPPENARSSVLRAADVKECSLVRLTASLSLLKGPGVSSPDLIPSNGFLKAAFSVQVFLTQRKHHMP